LIVFCAVLNDFIIVGLQHGCSLEVLLDCIHPSGGLDLRCVLGVRMLRVAAKVSSVPETWWGNEAYSYKLIVGVVCYHEPGVPLELDGKSDVE
jgi:hypothetical protein